MTREYRINKSQLLCSDVSRIKLVGLSKRIYIISLEASVGLHYYYYKFENSSSNK